jgi:putative acetyltransferase
MAGEENRMKIRAETADDVAAIEDLTRAAFLPMAFSDGSEAETIRLLRAAGMLTMSLVADRESAVVGHVAFSPVMINDRHDGWFGLGPISVRADLQRRGIGKAMVAAGLAGLRARGATGCALIGNPDIYGRMGFASDGGLRHGTLDPRLVQCLTFVGPMPVGELRFAEAFDADLGGS